MGSPTSKAHPLEVGNMVPKFSANDELGNIVSNTELLGTPYVLYFYPKDNTPGCTTQACDFRDNFAQFKKLGVSVFGISPDSASSHQKFKDKFSLPFRLIVDTDHKICNDFHVWVEKNMYGRTYMGVQRTTFLIDKSGKIAALWPKVKVAGHVKEVFAKAKELV